MDKILIVDDDIATITVLEELLPSKGYDVVGKAFSGEEAIKMAAESTPDLILMDIGMPGKIDGITAAQKIKETLGIPVLFLTGHSEEEVIERAKNAEPLGYIMKPFDEAQLHAAVQIALHAVHTNKYLQGIARRIRQLTSLYQRIPGFKLLTPKELQVATLIMQMKQTKEIAEELNLGITTVQWHRRNIRKKLGLVDRNKNLAASLLSLLD
jgi:DNA-binding NarL/FixJ family response regulator